MGEDAVATCGDSGNSGEDRYRMAYRFHDYTLVPASREVWHGPHRLALEPKVFQVLLYLLEHRDRIVSKAELLEQCWPTTFVSETALTQCLTRLRKAVQPTPTAPPVIATRHRQGYRFVAEVTVFAQAAPAPGDTAPLQAATPAMPPVSSDSPTLPTPHRSAPLATPATRPPAPGAERRQLTVLFCDVVDSTTLAGQLDPEDYRDVMGRYHATCTAAIQRYGGHVAQYLGDGLLVYFGWPQAHEDDARRAVHAGLALVTAVRDLGSALVQDFGLRLAVRIGMHTGLVVVGTGAEDTPYGQLAVGATPNLAAKIQALAAPDTIMISAATYALVQGYFDCASQGAHTLPGMMEPSVLYQVRQASGARGRLDVTPPQQRTPFVGRQAELAVLRERAAQAQQGLGQVVLLSGEAGMGKSRLLQEITTACTAQGFRVIECRCSPYAQHTALYPVIEWLQRALQFAGDTPMPERLERLEWLLHQARLDLHEGLPLLAALLNLDLPEACSPALQLTPQQQRQRIFDTLLTLLLALAARQPVLFVVEDLHWIDPTTLEWLGMLVAQGPTAPLFTVMTCRPTFVSPWGSRTHITLLTLPPLAAPQVTQMVTRLGGNQLSSAQRQRIVTQADGVPLFVEEVTKFVLAAHRLYGFSSGPASVPAAPEVPLPATLWDSLMARLDQLGPAKGTAQLGATIGREFPLALLQAVTPLEEDLLRQDLHQLVEAELLYQRGVGATAVYQFKHALIQEAAYASLLRRTRQHYHQQIAQVLETQFPDTVVTQPELLAHHYTEAGLAVQAIPCWQRAGQQASDRSANLEAVSHLSTGIELLKTLPETPEHTRQALALYLALGAALQMVKGNAAPEVEQAYTQAHALCQQVGETPELFPVLLGLWRFYIGRLQLHTAQELGEMLLRLAQRAQDPALSVTAHSALGWTLFYLGALRAARMHLEEAIVHYTPDQRHALVFRMGQDRVIACRTHAAVTLWFLGYPEQALAHIHDALMLAHELSHPFSLALAQWSATWVSQLRRDVPAVYEQAEATVALSTKQGFPLYGALGTIMRGWALAMQDQNEAGMTQARQGLAAYRTTGAVQAVPFLCTILAEVCAPLGHIEDGLQALAEAHALVEQHGERWWEAEVHRLRGVLLLRQSLPQQEEAEACFQQALTVACRQQAKSLELRAAMSLARLWQQQGKRTEARELLAPIYGWFTEGFDTADLQEAKALLGQLA
jgi:predicted ATPase/class 3 adenylate cyclase